MSFTNWSHLLKLELQNRHRHFARSCFRIRFLQTVIRLRCVCDRIEITVQYTLPKPQKGDLSETPSYSNQMSFRQHLPLRDSHWYSLSSEHFPLQYLSGPHYLPPRYAGSDCFTPELRKRMTKPLHIVIVGGGITGLVAAYKLQQQATAGLKKEIRITWQHLSTSAFSPSLINALSETFRLFFHKDRHKNPL